MRDLDAYLPSYVTFRRFCWAYCPGTAKRRIKQAVIKSAASAASLGFAGERQDDGPACGRRATGRSPANPRDAAPAADLITASLIRLLAVPGQYCPFAGLRRSAFCDLSTIARELIHTLVVGTE